MLPLNADIMWYVQEQVIPGLPKGALYHLHFKVQLLPTRNCGVPHNLKCLFWEVDVMTCARTGLKWNTFQQWRNCRFFSKSPRTTKERRFMWFAWFRARVHHCATTGYVICQLSARFYYVKYYAPHACQTVQYVEYAGKCDNADTKPGRFNPKKWQSGWNGYFCQYFAVNSGHLC